MNELIIEVNSKNKTGFGFRAYAETYDQMEIMDKIKTALKGGQVDLLVKPQIAEEDKNEIIDLLSLFISYGRIHTVKGVSYFQGTHEEAINRAEKLRDKISNFSE